jgi:sugar phosphate isomerase/epimerase
MKIGVSAFAWTTKLSGVHLGLLPKVREQGLDGLEIPMFDPASLATSDIRRAFEANDLECTICAILPAGINPISPDASVRKKSLTHLVQCVETSAELGAHLMGGPLFAPIGYLPRLPHHVYPRHSELCAHNNLLPQVPLSELPDPKALAGRLRLPSPDANLASILQTANPYAPVLRSSAAPTAEPAQGRTSSVLRS